MSATADRLNRIHNRLIVSCQAHQDEPFHKSSSKAEFAKAAAEAGAGGIRADGGNDVRAIRQVVDLAIIGIQ
jgi:N-acylglucosamine-6-phosphate 2-epimerase